MKGLAIFGSTGSIGRQTLEVARSYPEEFKVVSLICRHQSKRFNNQVKEFKPKLAVVAERDTEAEVLEAVSLKEINLVVMATVGISGLKPTLAAIKAGKNIALATKEVLVLAGSFVMKEAKKHQITIIPIDSEQAALWQCLQGRKLQEVKRLILTMGKGNLAKMSQRQLKKVSLRQVFQRRAWPMGPKITVDSATGMNKAFEVIETRWLLGIKPEKITLMVHPQYLCHSLVEFVDASILTELGLPDMKRYIHQALFYPQRKTIRVGSFLDLTNQSLGFEPAPLKKFPCLGLGFSALKAGGTMPALMHGADEAAVEAFLKEEISFGEIYPLIKQTMAKHQVIKNPDLTQIFQAHEEGRNCL